MENKKKLSHPIASACPSGAAHEAHGGANFESATTTQPTRVTLVRNEVLLEEGFWKALRYAIVLADMGTDDPRAYALACRKSEDLFDLRPMTLCVGVGVTQDQLSAVIGASR